MLLSYAPSVRRAVASAKLKDQDLYAPPDALISMACFARSARFDQTPAVASLPRPHLSNLDTPALVEHFFE
jgi:hypothetical protein